VRIQNVIIKQSSVLSDTGFGMLRDHELPVYTK